MPRSSLRRVALPLLAALAFPRLAHATLPGEGLPIQTNDYSIDLYQGPVLSANRVIGLGGAFVAIADGVEGSAGRLFLTSTSVPTQSSPA